LDERGRYWRRVKGMLMLQAGVPQAEVGRQLGVTRMAVNHWHKRLLKGEQPGSPSRRRGRISQLSEQDCRELREMLRLAADPTAHPTLGQIRELITAKFGVELSLAQVSRVARGIGWSVTRNALVPPEPDIYHAGWRRAQWAKLAKLANLNRAAASAH
jgi:transposase